MRKSINIKFLCTFFIIGTHLMANQTPQIINEILTTETSYNKALKEFKLHFVDFIANDRNDQNLKNLGTKINIPLATIVKLSDDLLLQIKNSNKDADSIANIFVNLASYFKVYGPFAADYTNIINLINEPKFKTNKSIITLTNRLTEARNKRLPNNKISKVDLNEYLITPIQRIPRYEMLLTELVKNNPQNTKIKNALAKIKEVAQQVNNFKL